jgi:vomeronasal 2 receptor
MAFAVEEINRNSMLLPNISLGYNLYDSCGNLWNALSAALSMTSGSGEPFQLNETCYGYPPVLGIVGDSSSTRTIAISSIVSLYRVPMVSCNLIYEQTRILVDGCHYV